MAKNSRDYTTSLYIYVSFQLHFIVLIAINIFFNCFIYTNCIFRVQKSLLFEEENTLAKVTSR